jgi:DNA-binding transcriptional ArsR family regulator
MERRGRAGCHPTQGHALDLLREAPDGLSLGEIAQHLGVSPPTASDTMKALVTKGLVSKQPGAAKRSIRLTLTRKAPHSPSAPATGPISVRCRRDARSGGAGCSAGQLDQADPGHAGQGRYSGAGDVRDLQLLSRQRS